VPDPETDIYKDARGAILSEPYRQLVLHKKPRGEWVLERWYEGRCVVISTMAAYNQSRPGLVIHR
jgi:hypothetical protein